MRSIAIPQPQILIPRFEFPRWLRHLKDEKSEQVTRMFRSAMGEGVFAQAMGGAGTVAVTPWYLSGGITAAQCAAAYQPKGAASLAASYVNLNNPGTNNAAPGVAPTLSNGWVFNGLTQYLTTGITPADGWSALVQFTNVTNSGRAFSSEVAKRFGVVPSAAGQVFYLVSGVLGVTPALTSGNLGIAVAQGYRNGVADGGSIPSTTGAYGEIYIGARNVGGGVDLFCALTILALAVYNTTLSGAQMLAIATAMNAL